MAMKRRSFLGFLGAGAVAGPKMAAGAAAKAIEGTSALSLAGVGMEISGVGGPSTMAGVALNKPARILELTKIIASFAKPRRDLIEEHKRENGVFLSSLEPDLHCLRSMSLSRKVSLQTDKSAWRHIQSRKGWLERELDELLGSK